jgi:CBS domain-containing protein
MEYTLGRTLAIKAKRNILTGLTVRDAMRVQVVSQSIQATMRNGVRCLIKYKINAMLLTDPEEKPIGVVSKTDILAAYYAGLSIDSPLEQIMVTPLHFCHPGDLLESALDTMRTHRIYRLFVKENASDPVVGLLAYPDIVGLLYQYCHSCKHSILKLKRRSNSERTEESWMRVKDVMTHSVTSFKEGDALYQIMETLAAQRFTAVLIRDGNDRPIGVISKTDLILAFLHGLDPAAEARTLLYYPRVISCDENTFLEEAIQQIVLTDRQRLFVHRSEPENIVGVFSISDAARARSGSCHACLSSRILKKGAGL